MKVQDTYSGHLHLKFLDRIDTLLFGRKTSELFADFWPTATNVKEIIAYKLNETSKIVFSNTITKASWGNWTDAKIISGNEISTNKDLKRQPGKFGYVGQHFISPIFN
jgi:hypothetical protein